ncbi:hypothetical protein BDV24DRAFT_62772 [Aspergillus arachidicola]|uniref:Uncharacterized protein n=1 Tax=Aspergillus arachidicola TaxID=656916 RepID=A0A5N6Y4R8_9EURO|nr:hypothetical protein BDV24DRAFT_62772 [Aspergillus arachidicola]
MSPSAVVGLQYDHTCCILLTLSNRHRGVPSEYELARLRRLDEKAVASHIIQISDYPCRMKQLQTVTSWPVISCTGMDIRYGTQLSNVVRYAFLSGSKRMLVGVLLGWCDI